jgi:nucleotide-binding universal stress UspA family protein
MFEKVLVALDGSHRSEAILRPLLPIARAFGSSLTLLHVVEEVVHAEEGEVRAAARRHMEDVASLARAYLEEVAAGLRSQGLAVSTEVDFGRPHHTIVSRAREGGYSLLAMATRGRGMVAGPVLGSTVARVLPESPVPVLTVRPVRRQRLWSAPSRIAKVVVPLDGSALAETALGPAQELASRLRVPLSLVQVLPVSVTVPLGTGTAVLWDSGSPYQRQLDVLVTGYLAGIGSRLMERGLQVEWDVLGGPVVDAIIDWARRDGPSLIVMATRGRSGLARLLGTITEGVVRRSRLPVLVIPPERA